MAEDISGPAPGIRVPRPARRLVRQRPLPAFPRLAGAPAASFLRDFPPMDFMGLFTGTCRIRQRRFHNTYVRRDVDHVRCDVVRTSQAADRGVPAATRRVLAYTRAFIRGVLGSSYRDMNAQVSAQAKTCPRRPSLARLPTARSLLYRVRQAGMKCRGLHRATLHNGISHGED